MNDPDANRPDASSGQPSPGQSPFGPGSPFVEYYRPPRLGIIHLLAWTAATAVLLKLLMAMQTIGKDSDDSMPGVLDVFLKADSLIYSLRHAAGMVGTGILVLAKMRRRTGRFQPGHWLLIVDTTWLLLRLSCWAVWEWWDWMRFYRIWAPPLFPVQYGPSSIATAGICFYTVLKGKDARRWKACFAVLGSLGLLEVLSYAGLWLFHTWSPMYFSWRASPIVGPVLLVALLVDIRCGPRRDWLHWLGVAVVAIGVLVEIAWWLWAVLAR